MKLLKVILIKCFVLFEFEFIKIRHRSRLQVTGVETGLKSQLISTPYLSYHVSMYNIIKCQNRIKNKKLEINFNQY